MTDLTHLAHAGAMIAVRVTPKASSNRITVEPGDDGATIRAYVTTAPEGGKANTAVRKLLAKAMGIAPSRLELVRGATARDKLFRLD